MYYIYILQSINNPKKLYIGFTKNNVQERLKQHNTNNTHTTKFYKPWRILYCEVYRSEHDARIREKKLKQYGSAWNHLKKRISNSFDTK